MNWITIRHSCDEFGFRHVSYNQTDVKPALYRGSDWRKATLNIRNDNQLVDRLRNLYRHKSCLFSDCLIHSGSTYINNIIGVSSHLSYSHHLHDEIVFFTIFRG